jgi:hypothetical protein
MLWVRSLLGLYVPRPYHHPEFAHKYRAVSIGTDEKLRLQVSSEDPSTASTDVWDPSVYGKHMKIIQSMSAMSGARSVFSFGTAGDVWFQLVHEIRWPALIALEIALETFLIVACGAALTAVALAEGKSGDAASFRGKILVSLTTVRLASDSVYGWQVSDPSSPAEIFVLACFGWGHWLLVTIASALIVARALRPQKSLVLAPDMVVTPNGAVQIRFMVVRGGGHSMEGMLYEVEITVQAWDDYGALHDVPLVRNKYAVAVPFDIITIRHLATGDSPFNKNRPGGQRNAEMCQVTMKALDADGNAVVSHVTYFGEGNFMDAAVLAKARPYPRILHAVFVDTYERVKDPVTGDSPRTAPKLVANLDNFGRTKPATQDERVRFPEN